MRADTVARGAGEAAAAARHDVDDGGQLVAIAPDGASAVVIASGEAASECWVSRLSHGWRRRPRTLSIRSTGHRAGVRDRRRRLSGRVLLLRTSMSGRSTRRSPRRRWASCGPAESAGRLRGAGRPAEPERRRGGDRSSVRLIGHLLLRAHAGDRAAAARAALGRARGLRSGPGRAWRWCWRTRRRRANPPEC